MVYYKLLVDSVKAGYSIFLVRNALYPENAIIPSTDSRPDSTIKDIALAHPKEWDKTVINNQ